ncbi:MAG: hypothetical protein AAF618_00045 [Pseudomonadota bacterium]
MATKKELMQRAKELGLDVSEDMKNAEIEEAIAAAGLPSGEPPFKVFCGVPKGRRRGGRRFDAGDNFVANEEMTEALHAALDADPHFTVTRLDAHPGD